MVPRRMSKSVVSVASVEPFDRFGPPQLLDGEDPAKYNELFAQVRAAVKPADIIEEMFVDDFVSATWESLRWRRLKSTLLRAQASDNLKDVLDRELDYDQYSEEFEQSLSETLQLHLPEDQAQELAQKCTLSDPDACDKVNELLAAEGADMDRILNRAQTARAEQLTQEYARQEPKAVKLVNEFLASKGLTLDNLIADALIANDLLTNIERIDRLASIAEARRSASLREIDWHRATLGKALRRAVQDIEDGEIQMIETTPANGKNAA